MMTIKIITKRKQLNEKSVRNVALISVWSVTLAEHALGVRERFASVRKILEV